MADAEDPSNKYDQAFFLDLAAKGKDAWNAWRRDPANKDVHVTFAGIDFSEAPWELINFSGFEFGNEADFSDCKWRGVKWEIAEDPGVFFLGHACFTGAAFGFGASFERAKFGFHASFDSAKFGDVASFGRAAFDNLATFSGTAFSDWAIFCDAAFGNDANFTAATFGKWANFGCAAFGLFASFKQTYFGGRVEFSGMSVEKWTSDLEAKADKADEKNKDWQITLKKRHEESRILYGSGPDRFLDISFKGARFDGEANFSGRTFEEATDFTNAHFYFPPKFDAVTNASQIDFTGAHVGFVPPGKLHWTKDSKVPVQLRRLRKIAEDTKNHDLERDLYIEERKAERGVYLRQLFEDLKKEPWKNWPRNTARLLGHLLWIAVMGVYWALADYGRSFIRPAAWLVVSVWLFHFGYAWILAPLMRQAGEVNVDQYVRAEWMVALGNAVPFVGPLTIDREIKKFLFCPGGDANCLTIPPEGFQALVIAQNVFSITCVFFIGLALRNYFRIK
ncbi:MAG: hypothetical protein M3178_02335 [Pseudomonadota bacterium]|nr:hypothetical protein [Pseudomonadota bacterium]